MHENKLKGVVALITETPSSEDQIATKAKKVGVSMTYGERRSLRKRLEEMVKDGSLVRTALPEDHPIEAKRRQTIIDKYGALPPSYEPTKCYAWDTDV